MLVLKAENIAVERDGKQIFEGAAIEINDGDHIALIGRNGVGKTTLINCLLGKEKVTSGTINYSMKIGEWGIVTQESLQDNLLTTREFVESETLDLFNVKRRLERYERLIQDNYEDMDVLSKYNKALDTFMELGGYEWEVSVEKSLLKLGLKKDTWNQPIASLSGGQKTRAKLAKAMQRNPKALVLDEPTNHLDAVTMQWLAGWLQSFKGAILFISHERAFIDQVATITYELTPEGTKKYHGGYSQYLKQVEHERKTLEAQYHKQQAEKRKLLEAVTQYKQWFQKSHSAASERDPFAKKKANKNMTRFKAKEAALERLENNQVEKPKEAPKINVELEGGRFDSKILLRFENAAFQYDQDEKLFSSLSFTIDRGDRIAVIGQNGTGKSTLLKLITGHLLPVSGDVIHHPQLKIGYFMQELEGLDLQQSVLEQILELPQMTQEDARTILACFLFKGDQVFKKVKDLSMGEKCRVAFVKLYFSEANLLVLDEPTNYLDIETRERIEDALIVYPGSVVTVSHDPYMLEKVANRVFSLDNGFYEYKGTYMEWKKHVHLSKDEQSINNEIERLELQLSNLIAQELEPGDEIGTLALQKQITDLKKQIYQLEAEKKS
ncbi:ribosomal protection-like ABC-F family protein [Pseudalkalibacillus salsuginis]|uniref:ribosomal protection-like ABC-F family protein n=1 Tax=Pseudalkalibacillus salsuginis TaxID=2910972 RepID=UPI001F267ED2|nr:ABC-F type ribosomal protection protein [Pseudalkalibacillus salsuginis]MCF6410800.1 ABC-F type ribosomal protection protein [Pseudalkalibacillus salsuginis]